ncbi:MAG: hypothetical protein RI885_704 [Actinomycetota bacterium]
MASRWQTERRSPRVRRAWSVAARVFAVQVLTVVGIAGAILLVLTIDARAAAESDAASTSLAVASTIAADPAVVDALGSDDPTSALQPYALEVSEATGMAFVTIMDPRGIRFTHPNPAQIGRPFLGTISAAQSGDTLTETYTGTLGPSVRAVVPIEVEGTLVGIVSAGVTTDRVSTAILPRIPFVLGVAVIVSALGGLGAILTRRSLARMTGGLPPDRLARMVDFYESVLHSVREGVVLTDRQRRIVLYNDEAADLLGLPPSPGGAATGSTRELGVDERIADLLESGRRVVEETHATADRVLLVNQEPAYGEGATEVGAVMTLRDQSALQSLLGELDSATTMTDALRSQAHEYSNTLHTVLSLLELGRHDEIRKLLATSSRTSQSLADAVLDASMDPVLGAVLVGKAAQASERGIAFGVQTDAASRLPLSAAETVSLAGNLLDNALEAAAAGPPPRSVSVRVAREGDTVSFVVRDSGPGVSETLRHHLFDLGATSKPADGTAHGVGLALVRRIAESHGGGVALTCEHPTEVSATFPLEATT